MVVWKSISFWMYPCRASERTRSTLNHCLKFPLCCISCHICYEKILVKNFSTVINVKLFVSKASNSCFNGLDFFQVLLASNMQWKYPTSSLSLIESKESSQIGWISKVYIACISCGRCLQTRPISSSRIHRISTKLGMQHHTSLLSSLIISFYILTI